LHNLSSNDCKLNVFLRADVDVAGPSGCQQAATSSGRRQICNGNQAAIERTLTFGRDLQALSVLLRRQHGKNDANKKMLRVSIDHLFSHFVRAEIIAKFFCLLHSSININCSNNVPMVLVLVLK
jgi:hypothetical protein